MAALNTDPELPANRWLWALAVAIAFSVGVYLLRPILLPFVLGALIAYLGDPLVDYLERHRLARAAAVSLVFLFFTAMVVLALVIALPTVLQQLDALVGRIPDLYDWFVRVAMPWLEQRLGQDLADLPRLDWSSQLADNWQSLGLLTARTVKALTGSGADLLLTLANLALVPVVAFYLMRDWDLLRQRLLDLLPLSWQDNVAGMAGEANEVLGAFLRGQFLVMCALAAIYGFGLWLVGVQLALLLGLMAGLASIVPYLGFLVGIVVSFIAAWAQFQDPIMLLWVLLVFGVGQALESMLLTPVLVGDRIGMHPVAVIFALMVGGQLAGFVGVLLALPVGAVVMVFLRHALHHYRASDIYGGD